MRCVIRASDRPEICTAVLLIVRPNARGEGLAPQNFILLILLKPYGPLGTLTSDSLPPFRTVSGDCMPALRGVHKISKSAYRLRRACPSVCPHGTTRLPLDGFLRNLIWVFFQNPSRKFQDPLKSTNNGYFTCRSTCIYDISLNSSSNDKCFRQKFRENQNTYFIFWKSCRLWDNAQKCGTGRGATGNNTAHALCMLDN